MAAVEEVEPKKCLEWSFCIFETSLCPASYPASYLAPCPVPPQPPAKRFLSCMSSQMPSLVPSSHAHPHLQPHLPDPYQHMKNLLTRCNYGRNIFFHTSLLSFDQNFIAKYIYIYKTWYVDVKMYFVTIITYGCWIKGVIHCIIARKLKVFYFICHISKKIIYSFVFEDFRVFIDIHTKHRKYILIGLDFLTVGKLKQLKIHFLKVGYKKIVVFTWVFSNKKIERIN